MRGGPRGRTRRRVEELGGWDKSVILGRTWGPVYERGAEGVPGRGGKGRGRVPRPAGPGPEDTACRYGPGGRLDYLWAGLADAVGHYATLLSRPGPPREKASGSACRPADTRALAGGDGGGDLLRSPRCGAECAGQSRTRLAKAVTTRRSALGRPLAAGGGAGSRGGKVGADRRHKLPAHAAQPRARLTPRGS